MPPWSRDDFRQRIRPAAIGMIHLQPLPGSPLWAGDLAAVLDAALADARALAEAGFGAIMVENFHDIPFFAERVPSVTVAAMTAAIASIRRQLPDLSVGVNVLRNDVESALGIAAATGARFVRVNVHGGAAVTDQGPIHGRAAHTLRLRAGLGLQDVGILADVRVKHARPLAERPLTEEAKDLRLRGLADAVIVSGAATGSGADPEQLRILRAALPDCPLLVGSGMSGENAPLFLPVADGCIVGTSLQTNDRVTGRAAISTDLAAAFLASIRNQDTGGSP